MDAVVDGQAGHGERGRLQPAPVADPEEDQVPDRGRNEAWDQDRDQHRAHTDARLEQQHGGSNRPSEQRRDRRERPGGREHPCVRVPHPCDARGHEADDRAEREERRLRTEHGAERQRADRREDDARSVRDGCRRDRDPTERLVAAVAGQQRASSENDRRAGERQADDEVPGRSDAPRCSGRSTQNQCSSSWTAARKAAAASAAGIPIRAPRPTRRRARSPDMGEAVSGELTRVRR